MHIISIFSRVSKQKRHPHFWYLCLVKVKVTFQSFLLHLLRSAYFVTYLAILIMVLISVVSSSNKLGNNFNCDTNLLKSMPSLQISNKEVLSCKWLPTNNSFWCRQEFKMWISSTLFKWKRFSFDNVTQVVFWTKGKLVCKNPLKRPVL